MRWSDAAHVEDASLGHGLIQPTRPYKGAPVSLVYAAASAAGAAMAADSLRVDLATGSYTTGHPKMGRVGSRLAGVAGVSDHDGFRVLTALLDVLDGCHETAEFRDALLSRHARHIAGLYLAWRTFVGPDPEPEQCLSIIIAERGLITEAWTHEDQGSLTLAMQQHSVVERVVAEAIGSRDPQMLAHTETGRALALGLPLRHPVPLVALLPALPRDLAVVDLEQRALDVVEAAVQRQSALPRPAWWPSSAPVLAAPVITGSV